MPQTNVSTFLATFCRALRSFVLLVSFLPDHEYASGGFSFNKVNLVKPVPRIWQFSISINIPVIVHEALEHDIQGRTCCSGNVEKSQWSRKWRFSRHVQFDSGSHVMTVSKVAWNGPGIISSCTIIPRWVSKWVWFSLKISLFFSSVWVVPDYPGHAAWIDALIN